MKRNHKLTLLSVSLAAVLSGCISLPSNQEIEKFEDQASKVSQYTREQQKPSRLLIRDGNFVDAKPVVRSSGLDWLKQRRVNILQGDGVGLPLKEVIKQFNEAGVNISSSLPLHNYAYNGFSIRRTNALTALEIISASTGLDFKVEKHPGGQEWFVSLLPMGVSEYNLNIGNREVEVNLKGQGLDGSNLGKMNQLDGDSEDSSSGSGQSDNNSKVKYTSTIFEDLEKELEGRLIRLIPSPSAMYSSGDYGLMGAGEYPSGMMPGEPGAAMPTPMPGGSGASESNFVEMPIGNYTLNRSTGRITVHAPRHVRQEIMRYLREVDMEQSANIELAGRIFVLSEEDEQSQGIDLQGFFNFASDKYGLSLQNNVINGLNVINTAGSVSVGVDDALASNVIGVVKNNQLFQIFNAYLESKGTAKTILEPYANTTSGVPAMIVQRRPFIFTRFVATGGGSSDEGDGGPATSNELFTMDFGTSLRILPKYDPKKDVIRAQIDLSQAVQSGTQDVQQVVTTLTDIETKTSQLPIQDIYTIQTEAVIRNGSLVIMGGQQINTDENNITGTMGLKDSWVGGLFGKGRAKSSKRRFYMVLSARAVPYTEAAQRDLL